MKILLILPPLTQFNTPYPATAYLASYLSKIGHEVNQVDMSLELILKIFSKESLKEITTAVKKLKNRNELLEFYLDAASEYENKIDEVIKFLQTDKSDFIPDYASREFLPEGPRFLPLDDNQGGVLDLFHELSEVDKAKHVASLFLDDLADVIREGVDSDFGFSRYAESLSSSLNSFDPILKRTRYISLIDKWIIELAQKFIKTFSPDVVGLSVPFPGNLLGALRIAQTVKKDFPSIKVLMGGGYINTELRDLEDPRIFDFVDYLTFDDGEKPLEHLLSYLKNASGKLLRTMYRENGKVVWNSSPDLVDEKYKNLDAPSYRGLDMNRYVSMMEMINPMQRLWSDGKWNKMILAHGCYWKKCSFCDVSLDYIGRYDPDTVTGIVDKMETIMKETGVSGFHFVDEAAPPVILKGMSEEIIKRGLKVQWWGNLRFDTYFTKDVTDLLKRAGCIAVTGGIEVASERVLKLINKGISIEKVATVTKNFKDSGIFVHAYLMYGFPTQTAQETIDSLEVVRNLFLKGYLHSAYWHRFALTVHSPIGKNPAAFQVRPVSLKKPSYGIFALNEIPFTEDKFVDHDQLGVGLKRALYNYMLGQGLEMDLRDWFDIRVPRPKVVISFAE